MPRQRDGFGTYADFVAGNDRSVAQPRRAMPADWSSVVAGDIVRAPGLLTAVEVPDVAVQMRYVDEVVRDLLDAAYDVYLETAMRSRSQVFEAASRRRDKSTRRLFVREAAFVDQSVSVPFLAHRNSQDAEVLVIEGCRAPATAHPDHEGDVERHVARLKALSGRAGTAVVLVVGPGCDPCVRDATEQHGDFHVRVTPNGDEYFLDRRGGGRPQRVKWRPD